MTASSQAARRGFVHTAAFYHSEQEYLHLVATFLAEGLSNGESAWVALPTHKIGPVRDALTAAITGAAAADVTWADITELGRNPARLLAAELAFVERQGHRRVRLLAEPVWPGRSTVEYPGCILHEALSNIAFDGCDVLGLCPYDASRLADGVLADARVAHPFLGHGGVQRRSPEYSIHAALDRGNEPLATSPVAVTYTVYEPADLSGARQHSSRYGRLLGMSADRIADLQLIVTELATNGLQHGGGTSRLALWEEDGHLICEARDTGFMADPLAGCRPPAKDKPSASGLFVVNALADLVRIHTTPTGTTIQAYLRLQQFMGGAL